MANYTLPEHQSNIYLKPYTHVILLRSNRLCNYQHYAQDLGVSTSHTERLCFGKSMFKV